MGEMTVKVYKDLMGANDEWAGKNRNLLRRTGTRMMNFIGSPGSGKTAFLEYMVTRLRQDFRFAVLEGDVETTYDAERLARLDCRVSQLLSGGACHLEAKLVHAALRDLPLADLDLVIVENVGNLVCPAEFDIGEDAKIAFLSVTEGEDKPAKYPLLFREAKAAVLTKTDLLPHLSFDLAACLDHLRRVNGPLPVFQVSARAGTGMDACLDWIRSYRPAPAGAR